MHSMQVGQPLERHVCINNRESPSWLPRHIVIFWVWIKFNQTWRRSLILQLEYAKSFQMTSFFPHTIHGSPLLCYEPRDIFWNLFWPFLRQWKWTINFIIGHKWIHLIALSRKVLNLATGQSSFHVPEQFPCFVFSTVECGLVALYVISMVAMRFGRLFWTWTSADWSRRAWP